MSIKVQKVYQIRFWLNKISPLIWRRFLVNPKTTTIADLHHLIQLSNRTLIEPLSSALMEPLFLAPVNQPNFAPANQLVSTLP